MHTDYSFCIPDKSEVVVFGKLTSMPKGISGETSYILGLLTAKYDLPHRYSAFWSVRARKSFC